MLLIDYEKTQIYQFGCKGTKKKWIMQIEKIIFSKNNLIS